MGCSEYRLILNGTPATADQLARFEGIVVEQEMDMAWQAQIDVPLCTDEQGNWTGETESFLQGLSRVRIEVRFLGDDWVPLIDGPIVSLNNNMHGEPGKSMLKLSVLDDSFYLHRDETVKVYSSLSDDQIATQIYGAVDQIASTDIDTAQAPANPAFDSTVLRGTQMQVLQQMARRQHMHAYVLPGDSAGASVGCFKLDPDPDKDFGLASMVVLGTGRNIFNLHSDTSANGAGIFRTTAIDLGDRSVTSYTADPSEIALLGTNPAAGGTIQRLLHPNGVDTVDLQRGVQGRSERSAYVLHAQGEVMKNTYTSILQPYKNVQVLGVNGQLSGTWLIQQVTHTLTRNHYGQSFRLMRNAVSAGTNSAPVGVPAEVC